MADRGKQSPRRGTLTLHLLLVLPLILAVTLGVLQFALLSVVEGAIHSAARSGAEVAERGGGPTEVLASIRSALAAHGIDVPLSPVTTDGNLLIVIELPDDTTTVVGNPLISATPGGPELRAGELRVTVCVQLTGGPADPVPNWLRFIGFSQAGMKLSSSALGVRESDRSSALVSERGPVAFSGGLAEVQVGSGRNLPGSI